MEQYYPLAVYTADGGTALAMKIRRRGKNLNGGHCGKEYVFGLVQS